MKNSLRNLFEEELNQNGYKKVKVNHYEKKEGNHFIFIDNDIDHLLVRIMTTNHPIQPFKCIKNEWFGRIEDISIKEFKNILKRTDNELDKIVNQLNKQEK